MDANISTKNSEDIKHFYDVKRIPRSGLILGQKSTLKN